MRIHSISHSHPLTYSERRLAYVILIAHHNATPIRTITVIGKYLHSRRWLMIQKWYFYTQFFFFSTTSTSVPQTYTQTLYKQWSVLSRSKCCLQMWWAKQSVTLFSSRPPHSIYESRCSFMKNVSTDHLQSCRFNVILWHRNILPQSITSAAVFNV